MHSDHKKSIHIVGVRVASFQRLTVAELRVQDGGRLVRITGENAAGKTSLLRAIRAALGGAKFVGPAVIRDGADEAVAALQLSNGFTVERRFDSDDPKGTLVVRSADGGRYSQTTLDGWLGRLAFDPLAFYSLKPEKQADTLLSLGSDPELPQKLARLRARRAALEEDRKPHNVVVRGRNALQKPQGARPEPIDVSAELQTLNELQAREAARDELLRKLHGTRNEQTGEHENGLVHRIARGRTMIAELERKLADARQLLAEYEAQAAALDEKIANTPDPEEQIEAVKSRIADADAVNVQLDRWREHDRALQRIDEAEAAAADLTAKMEACDAEKAELLRASGIDIPGLGFDEDGAPLLNGQPLAVASGRERIDLAVAVAMKANPQLRIALIDEANDMSLTSLARLEELAIANDFQIWVVRIGLEGRGEIHVEDGEACNTSEPAVRAPAEPQPVAAAAVRDEPIEIEALGDSRLF